MARPKIALEFTTIDCDRCGGKRLMTQPCPDCDLAPRPHETQIDLERRRRILAEFEAVEFTASGAQAGGLDLALRTVPRLIDNLHDALAAVARGGQSSRQLIESYGALHSEAARWTVRQPRPNTNRGRALGRSLSTLCEGFRCFVTALGAPTMLHAQDLAGAGQRLIRQAESEFAVLQEVAKSEALLNGYGGFGDIGTSARTAAGSDLSVEDLDARLQMMARADSQPASQGLGLSLHVLRHVMVALLDVEECLDVARVAEDAMGDLRLICGNPEWQARHGVVTTQFSTATFNLGRIDDSNDLEAVGAALQLVMQCRDGVIRHCLATKLATTYEEFERLNTKGSGHILKTAAAANPSLRLDENLSQVLRHAGAHFDYDVEGDTFITNFGSGGQTRIDLDSFMDQVLGYLQTAISLVVATVSAAEAQEIALEISRHTPERDILATAEMLLGFAGFAEAVVTRDQDLYRISASGDPTAFTPAAAGIGAIAPITVTEIAAEITDTDGTVHLWEAPVEPFHRYVRRDPALSRTDELLELMRAMSTVRLDSSPVWNDDTWAGMALMAIEAAASLSLRDRIRRLRALRDLARENERCTVADTVTAVLQSIRVGSSSESAQSVSPFEQGGSRP